MTDKFRLEDWITECDNDSLALPWFECEVCFNTGDTIHTVDHGGGCPIAEVEALKAQNAALVKAWRELQADADKRDIHEDFAVWEVVEFCMKALETEEDTTP